MSAPLVADKEDLTLLDLLNKLRKTDKNGGLRSILSLLQQV